MLYNFKQIGDFQRISLAIWFRASFSFNKIMRKRNTFYFSSSKSPKSWRFEWKHFHFKFGVFRVDRWCLSCFKWYKFSKLTCSFALNAQAQAQHWMQQMCNFIAAFDAIYCYLIKKKQRCVCFLLRWNAPFNKWIYHFGWASKAADFTCFA